MEKNYLEWPRWFRHTLTFERSEVSLDLTFFRWRGTTVVGEIAACLTTEGKFFSFLSSAVGREGGHDSLTTDRLSRLCGRRT